MDFNEILKKLNQEQQKVVRDLDHHLLVIAGPGTGKTNTLISKILYISKEKPTSSILALTFTKKACQEISERLNILGLNDYQNLEIGTFHQFCLKYCNYKANSQLASENELKTIIKDIIAEQNLAKLVNIKDLQLIISKFKNLAFDQKYLLDWQKAVFEAYQQKLIKNNWFDYDDILTNFLTQELNKIINYEYILVDEYQDTNKLQFAILKKLSTPKSKVMVIGDPLQAIYSFRGANNDAFANFENYFQPSREITLNINYRSCANLLKFSQSLYQNHSQLQANSQSQGKIELVTTLNEYSEADFIIEKIEELIGGSEFLKASQYADNRSKTGFRDIAIIYRTHRLVKVLKEKLKTQAIPFQLVGEGSFWELVEVKLVIAFFYLINDGRQMENFLKSHYLQFTPSCIEKINQANDKCNHDLLASLKYLVETRLVSNEQIKKIYKLINLIEQVQLLRKNESLADIANFLSQEFKFSVTFEKTTSKKQDFYEFLTILESFSSGLVIKKFLKYFEKLSNQDFYDENLDKITLCTMHAAKGLEFDNVFLLGFEQGLIPYLHERQLIRAEDSELEEEKRLFYVAITRAKTNLIIIKCLKRFGKKTIKSIYENNLDLNLVDFLEDKLINKIKLKQIKKINQQRQQKLF